MYRYLLNIKRDWSLKKSSWCIFLVVLDKFSNFFTVWIGRLLELPIQINPPTFVWNTNPLINRNRGIWTLLQLHTIIGVMDLKSVNVAWNKRISRGESDAPFKLAYRWKSYLFSNLWIQARAELWNLLTYFIKKNHRFTILLHTRTLRWLVVHLGPAPQCVFLYKYFYCWL